MKNCAYGQISVHIDKIRGWNKNEADIRKFLKLYLESEGFEVIDAEDGEEAISAAYTYKPDMAILDIMMPKLDGFAVTQALRQDSDIPILIVSARNQDNDKILGLNLGADDYISKPFNALEVVARVKKHSCAVPGAS